MTTTQDFELEPQQARYSSLMVKITWAVLIIGHIVGALFFWVMGGTKGEDLGALAWVASYTISVALISIRQLIWAERE